MSTFSKNLFDILGDDDDVRQPVAAAAPAKEQADERKTDKSSKANGAAPRTGAPRGARRGGARQQQTGRPQRGRQFDRHSGTGIVDTEKKVNQSWGHADTAEAEAAKDTTSPKDPASEDAAAVVAEPEEDVKTLDEYLAEKASKSLGVVLPEARKANEGSDDAKWKDAVAFVKEDEPDFYTSKESKAAKKASEKQRKEKVIVEIEQRFQEKPRAGFRGGNERRGADRGDRRGRGNGRRGPKNSNSTPAVNIKDDSAFPSLGA